MTEMIMKTASVSDDGTYRYTLARHWSEGYGTVAFIMLNPSTADAFQDDPTIRRCISFARRWGYSGIEVVNLYALRATNPSALDLVFDPVGPQNDEYIQAAALKADALVAAWGVHAKPERVAQVLALNLNGGLVSLGTTKDGHPRHPLYVRGDTNLAAWPKEN